MPGMMGGMPGMMGGGYGQMPFGPLQGFGMPYVPSNQFPSNPYSNGPLVPFMPFSETGAIFGFRIVAAVGTVWGAYDSPPSKSCRRLLNQMMMLVQRKHRPTLLGSDVSGCQKGRFGRVTT
jgi:hypothetical protein